MSKKTTKKTAGIVLLVALCVLALGQHADASLFGLPKSLKTSPLAGLEMSLRIWGPSAESFLCIEHLPACQASQQQAD
ncbi:MAG: hypothetical protein K2Y27_25580 [Xanthobacteraceae bacterium]|nr:hypothetical protein [Xanthobacteraceae bacterium]